MGEEQNHSSSSLRSTLKVSLLSLRTFRFEQVWVPKGGLGERESKTKPVYFFCQLKQLMLGAITVNHITAKSTCASGSLTTALAGDRDRIKSSRTFLPASHSLLCFEGFDLETNLCFQAVPFL